VIPAARGEFGDYRKYKDERIHRLISPLMSIYWFFDANKVIERNLVADVVSGTMTKEDARSQLMHWYVRKKDKRHRQKISY
jgi:hypothetical protein